MAKKTGLKEAKKTNNLKVGATLLKVIGVTVGAGVALIAGTNKIMSELTKEEQESEQEQKEDELEKEDEEAFDESEQEAEREDEEDAR